MGLRCYLGIDLGSTGIKALLIDEGQKILSSALVPVRTYKPRAGWVEQSPDQWWSGVEKALHQLRTKSPVWWKEVEGIGVTGQMHGTVLLDKKGVVLSNSISWNDGRAINEADFLNNTHTEEVFRLGVKAMAGLTAPKLLWLRNNRKELFEKVNMFLSPKDYIVYRLTNKLVTDFSDAAGTWLLDQKNRKWSEPVLQTVGIDVRKLPELKESTEIAGMVTPAISRLFGFEKEARVCCGGGDTPVGALGLGCVTPGQSIISLGTSAHVFMPADSYESDPSTLIHSFCHSLPGRWYHMAALLNGAGVLQWFGKMTGGEIEDLDSLLSANYADVATPVFLPYLNGERTPHDNPAARGVFFGLDTTVEQVDLYQAVLEGVGFALKEGYECLRQIVPAVSHFSLIGGGARSRIWAEILATILNANIIRYKENMTGPAFGAARLAILAVSGDKIEHVVREPEIEGIVEPHCDLLSQYEEKYEKFKRLYKKLETEFVK